MLRKVSSILLVEDFSRNLKNENTCYVWGVIVYREENGTITIDIANISWVSWAVCTPILGIWDNCDMNHWTKVLEQSDRRVKYKVRKKSRKYSRTQMFV